MKPLITLLSIVFVIACSRGGSPSRETMYDHGTPFVKVQARRLADMKIPRNTHLMHIVNGTPLVIGGHTTGFIPTPTAERFDGQRWNTIPMAYTHDGGFSTPLSDGSLLIGGGSEESFGIGQSWGVEIYHPDTQEFEPVGILDRPRAYASALTMPGDTVIVSGNWYADDAIEMYVPGEGFSYVKDVTYKRFYPVILQSAPGQAIIFGSYGDPWEAEIPLSTVDRLKGEPFEPQILKEWFPLCLASCNKPSQCAINDFTYLVPAANFSDRSIGILKVAGEQFSLLDCDHGIPTLNSEGENINYSGCLEVDRSSRHAYLSGVTESGQICIADINYDATLDGGKASVRMLTARHDVRLGSDCIMSRTPEGNLLLTGGMIGDNFHPSAASILIVLEEESDSINYWWILIIAILITILSAVYFITKKKPAPVKNEDPQEESKDMMSRIIALMEEEQLFRKKDLRVAEIANRLGTNTTYVSACINSQIGQSFNTFVTSYRIAFAKQLMKEQPEMMMSQVSEESGFTSERSFFRNFKSSTGQTPSQWKAN